MLHRPECIIDCIPQKAREKLASHGFLVVIGRKVQPKQLEALDDEREMKLATGIVSA